MLELRHNQDGTYQIFDPTVYSATSNPGDKVVSISEYHPAWGRKFDKTAMQEIVILTLKALFSPEYYHNLLQDLDIAQGRDDGINKDIR